MNGIIVLTNNYTYEGNIVNREPHGKGVFYYKNNDKYVGECVMGKRDGFGIYYFSDDCTYTGYFSINKLSGIGTFENSKSICKGSWRNGKKHGVFHDTDKVNYKTYKQTWFKNKKTSEEEMQYIQPAALTTTKINPLSKHKTLQISYKGNEKKCITCVSNFANATNVGCGHVVVCAECLGKCNKCPICRAPISSILKLYVS